MNGLSANDRGISPVIGVVLLVAIAVALVSVSAYLVFGVTQEREPAPEVVFDHASAEDGITQVLAHEQGDRLVGDKVTLKGAVDPDVLSGTNLTSGQDVEFYAVEEEIRIVYTGEYGTTYTLETFEVAQTVPEPDEGCDWVDSETNGGTDGITVRGTVVNCDVETDGGITVDNDGVVIGNTLSDATDVDADDAQFYGDVVAEDVVNIQDGNATGSVTSRTADVKIGNGDVDGSVQARKVVELQRGSSVDGSIESTNKQVKVLSSSVSGPITAAELVKIDDGSAGSTVETNGDVEVISGSTVGDSVVSDTGQVKVLDSEVSGSVVSDGSVKLDGATLEGDVYVDSSDFDCTSSTIDGENCSEYDPEDPADY